MKQTFTASLLLTFIVAFCAWAQTPAAPATPKAAMPNFCDVSYSLEAETDEQDDITTSILTLKAVPWADVEDNHKKQVRVLNALAKEQNKGGPYTMAVAETRACDGGNTVRISEGSLYVEGVTLDGTVKVGDVSLQVGKEINDRYRERAAKGAKVGWNHKNAGKVQRDEFGRKVKKDKA